MEFSECFKSTLSCCFSPNGLFVAAVEANRLLIRDAASLDIKQAYTCIDIINSVEWSPDSEYILCVQLKRKLVQLFSVRDPAWACKIDENLVGLTWAGWAPDSRHVLTCTEFQLRLTIWCLTKKQVYYIKYPKYNDLSRGLHFTHNGQYLIVCERREFKDYLSIYSTDSWEQIKSFQLETEDLVDFHISPNNQYIACQDTSLDYNLIIYAIDGRKLGKYKAYEHALGIRTVQWSPNNKFLAIGSYDECARVLNDFTWNSLAEYSHTERITPKERKNAVHVYCENVIGADSSVASATPLLGDKENQSLNQSLALEPLNERDLIEDEQYFRSKLEQIQIGSGIVQGKSSMAANKSRGSASASSLHSLSVSAIAPNRSSRLGASASVNGSTRAAAASAGPANEKDERATAHTHYSLHSGPYDVYSVKASASVAAALDDKAPGGDLKVGVALVAWSHDGRYLATRNENMPNTVWIWDNARLGLVAVLNHYGSVRSVVWHPKRNLLAMCTGSNKIYLWQLEGASLVAAPIANFLVKKLSFNGSGDVLTIMDKGRAACVYLQG